MCAFKTVLCALAIVGLLTVPAAADVVYDAAADFSVTNNPNGVWSYGYLGTVEDPSSFTQYTNVHDLSAIGPPPGIIIWDRPESFWDPGVAKNTTGSDITSAWNTLYRSQKIVIGPADNTSNPPDASLVRWTAPAAGTYAVSAQFEKVNILGYGVNDYALTQGWVNSEKKYDVHGDGAWTGTYTVALGDTIDFVATLWPQDPGWSNIPTQLDATITLVPEPSGLLLTVVGLFGLLAYAWRKRR